MVTLKISIILVTVSIFISCKTKWSDKDRSEFISGCMQGGAVTDMGKEKAKNYCQCMLEKIIVKYPDRRDAHFMRYDTSLARLAIECSKQP
jgi:hypothetical protein